MLRQPQRSRRGPATAARGPLSPQFGMRASRRIEHTCAKRLGPVEAKRTTRFHGADLHFACAVRGTAPPKTVPRGRDSASGLRGGPCRRQPIFGPVGESLRLWQEGWTAMLRQPQRSRRGPATAARGPLSPQFGMRALFEPVVVDARSCDSTWTSLQLHRWFWFR
jgi:hypothetical protein